MNAPEADPHRCADIILRCFDDFHTRFRAINRRTKERFERRDWEGIRRDTVKRLTLQPQAVDEAHEALAEQLGERLADRSLWHAMKIEYSREILGRDDFEISQTFFNSLSRRVFPHDGVDPLIDYVSSDFPLPYKGWEMASARMYATRQVDSAVIARIIADADFRAPLFQPEQACAQAARAVEQQVENQFGDCGVEALDVLRPVFIRNKAAYLVGRVRRDEKTLPLVFAFLNENQGIRLDAVLGTEDDASVVFSFARWYFHADIPAPREVIGFLHSILPRKRVAELYISLGYNKHGKTEFYGDLMAHIAGSDEEFVTAPGTPGLVMSVFTLPSYEFVFKIIRDTFPRVKEATREEVRLRYREVQRHDRVGRLVDFQEFEHLKFPRCRFSPALLDELVSTCSQSVQVEGEDVIIRHMYVGRRVRPLDLAVQDSAERAEAAVIDWGHALKDLAAANIFAGDMLLKNFGVTRHGRVVFYDYDEICPLVDCNFRHFPKPRTPEQEMAAEPWFSVAPNDVFPEEMRTFLGLGGRLLEVFMEHHGDLFEVGFWRRLQERNRQGELIDFYPYSSAQRLSLAAAKAQP